MTSAARTRDTPVDLQTLHSGVWHAHTLADSAHAVQATGEALLDTHLPGGGWPVGGLTELLQDSGVHSEWRLLLPALARCGQGPVVLVGAPLPPFVPALHAQGLAVQRVLRVQATDAAQRMWSAEQALRCAAVDAVLLWMGAEQGANALRSGARKDTVRPDQLRRLQMAAAEHQKLLFVMRPSRARHDASPAVLRLQLAPLPEHDALALDIFKRKGPPLEQPLQLPARAAALRTLLAASSLHPMRTYQRVEPASVAMDTPAEVAPVVHALATSPGNTLRGGLHALDRTVRTA